jgi:hypothetical protein
VAHTRGECVGWSLQTTPSSTRTMTKPSGTPNNHNRIGMLSSVRSVF